MYTVIYSLIYYLINVFHIEKNLFAPKMLVEIYADYFSYKLVEQSEQNQLTFLFVAHLLLKSCQRKKFFALPVFF